MQRSLALPQQLPPPPPPLPPPPLLPPLPSPLPPPPLPISSPPIGDDADEPRLPPPPPPLRAAPRPGSGVFSSTSGSPRLDTDESGEIMRGNLRTEMALPASGFALRGAYGDAANNVLRPKAPK